MKKITAILIAATLLSGLLPAMFLQATPVPDTNGPYVADEGTSATFNASASTETEGGSLEYRWDFDNNGTWDTPWSNSTTASYTWYDDWTGMVKVEVSNGTITDTALASVTINNVAPVVEAGPDQMADEGDLVNFSGNFTDPGILDTHDITWDFGDGDGDTGTLTPTHTYADDGVYTVNLTVIDDDGGFGTDTLTVTVNNVAPTAAIDSVTAPDPIEPGDMISFNGSATDPGEDTLTFEWNFGDGVTASGESVDHAYASPGTYTVTLTVTDDDGGSGSATYNLAIIQCATVDIDPNTLNLKSRGRWITCYIELPEGYDVLDIDVGTVTLSYGEHKVTAEWGDVQDGVLMVKFDRSEVAGILSPGGAVELTVTGELTDGTSFEGSDTIRVISRGKR